MVDRSRIASRGAWAVRRFRLDEQPGKDLSSVTTPRERLDMICAPSVEAWTLTGVALPDYVRRDAPVRVVPLGDPSGVRKA